MTAASLAAIVGCGGGERQDEDEVEGSFPIEVTTSEFPARQRLASTSELRLGIRNTGEEAIPNLAVTVFVDGNADGSFKVRDQQPDLSDPNRPVWILEEGYPKVADPSGAQRDTGAVTAYTNTWAFGRVEPGGTVEAIWKVTAVRGGTHTVTYRVAGGLDGKAKAVGEDGAAPTGKFVATISTKAPNSRVSDSGKVVRD